MHHIVDFSDTGTWN